MAQGYLPEIGSEFGPCERTKIDGEWVSCGHTDCAQTRIDLARICHHCDEALGTRGFFRMSPSGGGDLMGQAGTDRTVWVHAVCEMRAIEKERAEA